MIRIIPILFILYAACTGSDTPLAYKEKKQSAGTNDTSFNTLLDIGGCYAYPLNEDSLIGLILYGIVKDEGIVYYYFNVSGKIFKSVPSKKEFREAGILGKRIASGDFSSTAYGFEAVSISEKDIYPDYKKLILIQKIHLAKDNPVAGSGMISSLNGLSQQLAFLVLMDKKLRTEPSVIPMYPHEAFSWSRLRLTTNESEMAKPRITWRLTPATAHPAAVRWMNEDWYWDITNDLSPFGNDDGYDALYSFKEWREKNKDSEPALFLNQLEKSWGISFAHKDVTNESELKNVEKENTFYRNVDREIIAAALAQIALEGKISPKLKNYGVKATKRAMTEYGMHGMTPENKKEYKSRFNKILDLFTHF